MESRQMQRPKPANYTRLELWANSTAIYHHLNPANMGEYGTETSRPDRHDGHWTDSTVLELCAQSSSRVTSRMSANVTSQISNLKRQGNLSHWEQHQKESSDGLWHAFKFLKCLILVQTTTRSNKIAANTRTLPTLKRSSL
jgi:hypothetical protein